MAAHARPSTCVVAFVGQHGGLAVDARAVWLRLDTSFTSSDLPSQVEGL